MDFYRHKTSPIENYRITNTMMKLHANIGGIVVYMIATSIYPEILDLP